MRNVEDHNRHVVVHAERGRRGVHDLEAAVQHLHVVERVEPHGVRAPARVLVVDPVDPLLGHQDRAGLDLDRPQRRGRVGREVRAAGAAGEDDHPALLEMPHRPPPDVGLGDLAHLHRGLHPRLEALALHRVLERQGVDDRGEQSHVVRGRAVEAGALGELHAPDDIAPAHDDGHVHPVVSDGLDLARHQVQHLRVDARPAGARQRLPAQFEQDAPVGGPRHSGRHSPNRKRAKRRTWMFSPVLAITPLIRSPTVWFGSRMNGWLNRQTVW